MSKTGYLTGTFDFPIHDDHFRLLAACKNNCDYLIVGLVADDFACIQKRKTILSYDQRRCILENSKHVDLVVPHNGESKSVAWDKLKFDRLFSTDEYMGSPEFTHFEFQKGHTAKHVTTMYFPKNTATSSTSCIDRLYTRFMREDTHILCHSIAGPIFKAGNMVFKPLMFAQVETTANMYDYTIGERLDPVAVSSQDIFRCIPLFGKYPRNMKGSAQTHPLPSVTGANSGRELIYNELTKNEPFSLYIDTVVKFIQSEPTVDPVPQDAHSLSDMAQIMNQTRVSPVVSCFIQMKHGGQPLARISDPETIKRACRGVHDICKRLQYLGIVHGDIHSNNIIIGEDARTHVYIIDGSWSTSNNMQMSPTERTIHDLRLKSGFDWNHFIGSMRGSQWLQNVFQDIAQSFPAWQ